MRKVFFAVLSLTLSFSALACNLPRGEVLKIGCTYECDLFYRFRITMTAWGLGYSTQIINLQRESGDAKEALGLVDGVLFPGGADIDPKYYLPKVSPELRDYTEKNLHLVEWSEEGRERDPFEYELLREYSENEMHKSLPFLGICRGMQMMSVVQGIPLYLDIKTELGIRNRRNLFDRISLEPTGSLMSSLYRKKTFRGFKLHHQGIRVPYYTENASSYPNTKVSAYSNNKRIAEAIEYTHRPALGVQYHPERSFSTTSVPVFRWFLTKACEFKKSRKETP